MLSGRKPLVALAAVTAALAAAVPAASASAARTMVTVDPTCQLLNLSAAEFRPGMFLGGATLDNTPATAGTAVSCASPVQSLLPTQWR